MRPSRSKAVTLGGGAPTRIAAPSFSAFAAIDWSGAKGSRHPGIALGWCDADGGPPRLIDPPDARYWSRAAILGWIADQNGDVLIGFDFSFAPPRLARGSYLPGEDVPATARRFWAYVDALCDDADLGAASFLEVHHRRHFYLGAADGAKADYVHFRQCELAHRAAGGAKPSTVYDAIGAAQVAKASFAGMRLLARLPRQVHVWPFDPLPAHGPVVVEIYSAIAARAAGLRKGLSKLRDAASLDAALDRLGSPPHRPVPRLTDHAADALLTAAWMRANAADSSLWRPRGLTRAIARSEGWTFGIE